MQRDLCDHAASMGCCQSITLSAVVIYHWECGVFERYAAVVRCVSTLFNLVAQCPKRDGASSCTFIMDLCVATSVNSLGNDERSQITLAVYDINEWLCGINLGVDVTVIASIVYAKCIVI